MGRIGKGLCGAAKDKFILRDFEEANCRNNQFLAGHSPSYAERGRLDIIVFPGSKGFFVLGT